MGVADIPSRRQPRFARARLILAAGLRLATFYVVCVLLLLAVLMAWNREWVDNVEGVMALHGRVGAFLLVSSFIALITLRRAGIVVLWLALLSIWFLGLLRWTPIGHLTGFVWWSILAFPLYVITIVGFPAPPSRIRASHIVVAGWITLLAVTLRVTPTVYFFLTGVVDGVFRDPPASFLRLVPSLWGPAPVLITVHAVVRLTRHWRKRDWDLRQSSGNRSSDRRGH